MGEGGGGGGVGTTGAAPPAPRSARPCRCTRSSRPGTTTPRRRRRWPRRLPMGAPLRAAGQRSSPRPCRRCCRRRRWWCWRSTRRGTTGRRRSGWRSGRWSRAGTSSVPAATPSSCSACSTPSPIPVRATLPLLFPRVTFSQLFLLELKLPLLLTPTAQKLYLDELTYPKCCLVAFCIYIVLHN